VNIPQRKENPEKTAELSSLISNLDSHGQKSALSILKALKYTQSLLCPQRAEDTDHTTA